MYEMTSTSDQVSCITGFVEDYLRQINCSERSRILICAAVDDVLDNICRYAYAPDTGPVTVHVDLLNQRAVITVIDSGKPFDPLTAPEPDTSLPIRARPIGGLGIYMVRKTMDEISYRREGGKNILTLQKTI